MKKIFLLFTILFSLIVFAFPNYNVYASEQGVANVISGEYICNLTDLKDDSIILYADEETGMTLSIDIISYKPEKSSGYSLSGNTGWSGGYIPEGTTVIYPHLNNPTLLYPVVGCYLNVTIGSSNKINSIYNPTITTIGLTVNSLSYSINNSTASSSNPARATMNWIAVMTESGVTVGSESNYFTVEINNLDQARIIWRLSL